jgi:hypothetical protein
MITEIHSTFAWTHMPFLGESCRGERVLFYTAADDGNPPCWRLHYIIGNEKPQRLETGFPQGTIECSPTAWEDTSGWHVSFVSNGEPNGMIYRLYRMDGPTLDQLSQPISLRIARTGFVYQDRIAVGEIQDVVHVHDTNGDRKIVVPGAFLYRISYRADAPDKLLISGDWIGETGDVFCIEYDLTTDEQRYIECDGKPAYKCTIFQDDVLYAERLGGFENRRIKRAVKTAGICCRIAERAQDALAATGLAITKKCGCRRTETERRAETVRPSCLECVEKHLGAAMVILSEIHDGYSYRLRFVGHLHEAEEESQDFQVLHQLIRQSRKEYQREATIPQWETLAGEIENVRRTT